MSVIKWACKDCNRYHYVAVYRKGKQVCKWCDSPRLRTISR
jgi:hypothetical protein